MKEHNEKIRTILVILFILTIFITPISLAKKEVGINIKVQPQGIISKEYNVVGDIFSYNVSLINYNNEKIEGLFAVTISLLGNRTLSNNFMEYNISLEPNSSYDIIPYINLSKNNHVYIWPFDTVSDYKIEVCSINNDIRFVRNYSGIISEYQGYLSSYYYDVCFPYYFSAMPEWQYKLFQEESKAAEKVQEANQKLLDLNIELESATKSTKIASWIMVIVAIITLVVALASKNKKDKTGKKEIN